MPTPDDKQLLRMDGWPGGVNNRMRETEQSTMREGEAIPSSQFLRKALNVDFTSEGHPLRRRGKTQLISGYTHSVWTDNKLGLLCCVIDGQLKAGVYPDLITVASVNKYLAMSYCVVNDSIYYSNGNELGEIGYDLGYRLWGVPVGATPVISGPSGDNPKGWEDARQVSVTYVDAYGREGGASEPVLVGADGSFTVTIPMPLPSGVTEALIYVSEIGSEILYHSASTISVGTVTIYPENVGVGKELDTLNLMPPLAGQLVRHFNGRIYVARNDTVMFTEALRFHLTRPAQGIYLFPDNVKMLEPSTDGVYVGHNKGVVFISGADPYDIRQIHVSPYAPVSGAVSRVPGEKFGVMVDELPVWWGVDGTLVVGLPGGQLRQLTRDRLAVPKYGAGAVSIREREGMSHVVSSLRSGESENSLGATDTVVAEVRRNKIVLNN